MRTWHMESLSVRTTEVSSPGRRGTRITVSAPSQDVKWKPSNRCNLRSVRQELSCRPRDGRELKGAGAGDGPEQRKPFLVTCGAIEKRGCRGVPVRHPSEYRCGNNMHLLAAGQERFRGGLLGMVDRAQTGCRGVLTNFVIRSPMPRIRAQRNEPAAIRPSHTT